MRYLPISLLAILLLAASAAAEPKEKKRSLSDDPRPAVEVDPEMREVLRKINSASAYDVPDLGLREDEG